MRRLLVLPIAAVLALAVAGVSNAGREQQVLNCGGGLGTVTVTVTTTKNDHSVAWGTGKVSKRLHGIPVSFTFTVTDLTTNTVLNTFTQSKGHGHGMHRAQTINCTGQPETGTAAELGITNVTPTDMIQLDFSARVVLKP